jgi:membrane-bound inhibitor of C-type lysozyme
MMRKQRSRIVLAGALLLCAACGRPGEARSNGAATAEVNTGSGVVVAKSARPFVYRCKENTGFTLYVMPETAWVQLPNRTVRLPRDEAKQGTRYSNGSIDFTLQNGVAQMETEEMTYTDCRSK